MKIGGFQAVTLSDFPCCVSAIVFTQGCNFRCPYCHNASLLPLLSVSDTLIKSSKVINDLAARKKMLNGVVISGGEPTLQEDLLEFIIEIKGLGYKVKLDTNGSRPDVLQHLINLNILDYIAMDIKAPVSEYDKLTAVKGYQGKILQSIEVIRNSKVQAEFRTTYVPSLLSKKDMQEIASMVPAGFKYSVQDFISENAMDKSLRDDNTNMTNKLTV